MQSLPVFLRLEGRPVMLLGEGAAVDAKRRLLERAGARVVGRTATAALAIVGPDEPAEAVEALRAAGVLVNAVDRPALCDWTLPAIVDRAPVLIAVGTGGASAGLAAAVRQRLEALLPAGLGRVADALHAARATLRARYPDEAARRRAIGALLAPGGSLDPLADRPDPAATLDAALRDEHENDAPGRIEQVRLRSADPDELTLRAARLLAQADRLFHAPDVPDVLLNRARADAARHAGPAPVPPPPGLSVEVIWA